MSAAQQFIAADAGIVGAQTTAIMRVAPGGAIAGDGSVALAAADGTIQMSTGGLFGDAGTMSGFLGKRVHADHLPTPAMFPATVRGWQLRRWNAARAAGSGNLVVQGDSIDSIGANLISTAESPVFSLADEIARQNPDMKVVTFDCAIGGKTWADMWNDASQPPAWFDNDAKLNWKQFVCAANPDLLVLYSGGNDGYGFDCTAFHNLLAYYQTASNYPSGNVPDIILAVTYQPSLGSTTNGYNTEDVQDGIDFVAAYIRNYAVSNGLPYLDYGRWHSMCRDGIDPCELALERVQLDGTVAALPGFNQTIALPIDNQFVFPAVSAKSGVSAAECTSWMFTFMCMSDPGSMEIPLSNANGNSATPAANHLFILNNGGNIAVTYSDGVNQNQLYTTSNVPWPTGTSSVWSVTVKGGRVRVEVQTSLDNGWNDSGQGNVNIGMGMVVVFDEFVARFGAPYAPSFQFGKAVSLIVYNLCVGSTRQINRSCQRYRPIVSNRELYLEDDSAWGGSGSYHMNMYGVRLILTPVNRAQEWRGQSIDLPDVGNLAISGNMTVGGPLIGQGLAVFNDTWLGANKNQNAPGVYYHYDTAGKGIGWLVVNGNADNEPGSLTFAASDGRGNFTKVFQSDAQQFSHGGIGEFNGTVWLGASTFSQPGVYVSAFNQQLDAD